MKKTAKKNKPNGYDLKLSCLRKGDIKRLSDKLGFTRQTIYLVVWGQISNKVIEEELNALFEQRIAEKFAELQALKNIGDEVL
jgi:hypothetical protein